MAKHKEMKNRGILGLIERGGNALPHPASLFCILALLVLLLSLLGYLFHWHAVHPATGETINTINLLSKDGLHKILLEMVNNYTGFAPLGIVMVAMLGIGIAESSGLISAAIRYLVFKSPARMLTFVIIFAGIISNTASDVGYVLIIPLGGIIFHSIGRHPIAGIAAAFAGVSGGFSANLLIGTIDPLLAGLSTEAARIIDPEYYVLPTSNYYFMVISTFVLAFTGTWVTHRFVEPKLGKYEGNVPRDPLQQISRQERKGLKWVAGISLAMMAVIAAGIVPEQGILRGPDGSCFTSPVLKGFIALLFVVAAILGIVYGAITGAFKNDADVVKGMVDNFKTLAAYLVLVFFAAQFVAFFKWSNLGLIIAIKGAERLHSLNIGLIPLVLLFVLFSGFINMFLGSASAKWAILGPVFIPMFMLLGYSPELSQVVYRIGDSITNMISPTMSFFALIIVYFEKYDKKAGIGTLMSTMIPFTVVFFISWSTLLIAWILLDMPLGPGAGLYYE